MQAVEQGDSISIRKEVIASTSVKDVNSEIHLGCIQVTLGRPAEHRSTNGQHPCKMWTVGLRHRAGIDVDERERQGLIHGL